MTFPTEGASTVVDVAVRPRDASFVEASGEVLLVVLAPAEPMLVDRATGDVAPAQLGVAVVSADPIR